MKKTIVLAAVTLTLGWSADTSTASAQPSATTPSASTQMRQMPMFSGYDLDHDGRISQSEFDKVRADRMNQRAKEGRMLKNAGNTPAFTEIDTNKDGYLSTEEFRARHMVWMKKRQEEMEKRVADTFAQIDTDHNGQVSLDEFRSFHMQMMQNRKRCMVRIEGVKYGNRGMGMRQMPQFNDYDLDSDGKVTQKEFDEARAKRMSERAKEGKMMRNAGNAPTFSQIDTNNDGIISAEEFKAHQTEQMSNPPKGMMQGQGMKCGAKN